MAHTRKLDREIVKLNLIFKIILDPDNLIGQFQFNSLIIIIIIINPQNGGQKTERKRR